MSHSLSPPPDPYTPLPPLDLTGLIPRHGICICTSSQELAKAIAHALDGQLRFQVTDRIWIAWDDATGRWRDVRNLRQAVTAFAATNFGTRHPNLVDPMIGQQSVTVSQTIEALSMLPGIQSTAEDWDRLCGTVGLPHGDGLDVVTASKIQLEPQDLVTRRIGSAPAPADAYDGSIWQRVVEQVLPDANVRTFVRNQLGIVLAGMSTKLILWLYGNTVGKTTMLEMLAGAFGTYVCRYPTGPLKPTRRNAILASTGARLVVLDNAEFLRPASVALVLATFPRLVLAMSSSVYPPLIHQATTLRQQVIPIACGPPLKTVDSDLRHQSTTDPAALAIVVRWLFEGATDWECGNDNRLLAGIWPVDAVDDRKAEMRTLEEFSATFTPGDIVTSSDVWMRWKTVRATAESETCQFLSRRTLMMRLHGTFGWKSWRLSGGVRAWRVPTRKDDNGSAA